MNRFSCKFRDCLVGFPLERDCRIESSQKNMTEATLVHKQFVDSTSMLLAQQHITNHESIPSLQVSYANFTEVFPRYEDSLTVDEIRGSEYEHLQKKGHVCLDYVGIGLFSHLQQLDLTTSSLSISYSPVNLVFRALYGEPEKGCLEDDITKRIFRFLNIMESEYSIVFTATKGSAFKLLSEYYPFHSHNQFLSVYDYHSEELNWMIETSRKKGAKVMSASFKWPSFRICKAELHKALAGKKKNNAAKGLFVFPAQSKLTGNRYSFQWMYQAQRYGWHVLLDACAVAPKEMASLGLALFKPDFIICSFFKVYGNDPTGFGCLFVKKSSALFLDSSAAPNGIGIVKVVSVKGAVSSKNLDAVPETGMEENEISVSGVVSGSCKEVQDLGNMNDETLHSPSTDAESRSDYDVGVKNRCSRYHHSSNDSIFENTESLPSFDNQSREHDTGYHTETEGRRSFVQEIEEIEDDTQSSALPRQMIMPTMHSFSFPDLQSTEENVTNIWTAAGTSVAGPDGGSGNVILHDRDLNKSSVTFDGAVIEESKIQYRSLDHAESLGLYTINARLRYLTNWLVTALLKLRHPNSEKGRRLVKIYGPKVKFDRGPAIAFNLYDWKGELVEPVLVQKLADRSHISLNHGFLCNIWFPENVASKVSLTHKKMGGTVTTDGKEPADDPVLGLPVVNIMLSFLTNFEDVYKLWAFVARFLDADFVAKEKLRYKAVNQQTVEL